MSRSVGVFRRAFRHRAFPRAVPLLLPGWLKIATLVDPFDGSALEATRWTEGHFGGGDAAATVSGGLLHLDGGLSGDGAYVESARFFDLTESAITWQVTPAAGATFYAGVLDREGSGAYVALTAAGDLELWASTPAGDFPIDTLTYDPDLHRQFRYRIVGATQYIEAAGPDGSWATLASGDWTAQAGYNPAQVRFYVENDWDGTDNAVATVDGINVAFAQIAGALVAAIRRREGRTVVATLALAGALSPAARRRAGHALAGTGVLPASLAPAPRRRAALPHVTTLILAAALAPAIRARGGVIVAGALGTLAGNLSPAPRLRHGQALNVTLALDATLGTATRPRGGVMLAGTLMLSATFTPAVRLRRGGTVDGALTLAATLLAAARARQGASVAGTLGDLAGATATLHRERIAGFLITELLEGTLERAVRRRMALPLTATLALDGTLQPVGRRRAARAHVGTLGGLAATTALGIRERGALLFAVEVSADATLGTVFRLRIAQPFIATLALDGTLQPAHRLRASSASAGTLGDVDAALVTLLRPRRSGGHVGSLGTLAAATNPLLRERVALGFAIVPSTEGTLQPVVRLRVVLPLVGLIGGFERWPVRRTVGLVDQRHLVTIPDPRGDVALTLTPFTVELVE